MWLVFYEQFCVQTAEDTRQEENCDLLKVNVTNNVWPKRREASIGDAGEQKALGSVMGPRIIQ